MQNYVIGSLGFEASISVDQNYSGLNYSGTKQFIQIWFQERSSANLTSDTRLSYEDSGSNDSSYESYGFNEISFVERYLGYRL